MLSTNAASTPNRLLPTAQTARFRPSDSAETHLENTLESFGAASKRVLGISNSIFTCRVMRKSWSAHDHDLFAATGRPAIISELDAVELGDFDAGFGFKSKDGTFPFALVDCGFPNARGIRLNSVHAGFFSVEIKPTTFSRVRPSSM